MSESRPSCIVGIDGGGTSCRIGLVHGGRRLEHVAGSANVSTNRTAAIGVIREGLAKLGEIAGISPDEIAGCHAYAGLAGVMDRAMAREIAAALPFARVIVEDDRTSTIVGALGESDGAVAGIGTGSFLARQVGKELRFVGGWGLVLGDEASGAWLGRGLLAATLRAVDGLTTHSPLTRAIEAERGGTAGIVAHAATATPQDFAALAPRIVGAAVDGDPVAADLMRQGAAYVGAALDALGWTSGEPLCLLGGVGPHYQPHLSEPVAGAIAKPRGSALDGALALAARLGGAEG